jgi:hypothetical protein
MSNNRHRLVRILLATLFTVILGSSPQAAAPLPPTNLSVVVTGMTVMLTWARASVGDIATSFVLEAGTVAGASDAFAGNVGNTTTLSASAPSGTYFVRVRAVNSDGMSAPSHELAVVVGAAAPCAMPSPPASVTQSVSGTNVTVGWSAVSGATSYQLEAGSVSGAANLFSGDVGSVTSLNASVALGTYFVRLRSRNPCGMSAPSSEVVITVGTSGDSGTGGTGGSGNETLVGTTTDAAGDVASGSPDLVAATLTVSGGNLDITVQYVPGSINLTPRPVGSGGTIVRVWLDMDNNTATGNRGTDTTCVADNGILGADFLIVFGPGEDGSVRGRVQRFAGPSCNDFVLVGYTAPGTVMVDSAIARVVVPLSILANDDGHFAFKVTTSRALGTSLTTAVLDRMSNPGMPPGVVPNP